MVEWYLDYLLYFLLNYTKDLCKICVCLNNTISFNILAINSWIIQSLLCVSLPSGYIYSTDNVTKLKNVSVTYLWITNTNNYKKKQKKHAIMAVYHKMLFTVL